MSARSSTWSRVLGAVLGLPLLLGLLITAFGWPAANTEPRDVPLGVAAPDPVAAQVEDGLSGALGAEAFAITRYADEAEAVAALEDREVYGALVVGADGPRMLTASAAGPVVAQLLSQVAANIPAEMGGPVPVRDVVPTPADDPRGSGLAAGSLPLVIGGILAGAILALQLRGRTAQLTALVGVAAVGGAVMVAVLQLWLGALDGSYWANTGVVAVGLGAVVATLLGLHRVVGVAGLGLGAATMLLLGNPLSGLTSAPEMLPSGWGTLGQLLPPGALGTALRSVAFFDGAGAGTPLVVLTAWLVGGLVLLAVPAHRQRAVHAAEPVPA